MTGYECNSKFMLECRNNVQSAKTTFFKWYSATKRIYLHAYNIKYSNSLK